MAHQPSNALSPIAGKPAPRSILVDLARLERDYYQRKPDLSDPTQLVSFGTSGHRGSSLRGSFTEAHIAVITQAICEYRRAHGVDGPLHMGKDAHGLSEPAQRTALEVLAANDVETIIQRNGGVTPTPVISWAILTYNRGRKAHLADGIRCRTFSATAMRASPPRSTRTSSLASWRRRSTACPSASGRRRSPLLLPTWRSVLVSPWSVAG